MVYNNIALYCCALCSSNRHSILETLLNSLVLTQYKIPLLLLHLSLSCDNKTIIKLSKIIKYLYWLVMTKSLINILIQIVDK